MTAPRFYSLLDIMRPFFLFVVIRLMSKLRDAEDKAFRACKLGQRDSSVADGYAEAIADAAKRLAEVLEEAELSSSAKRIEHEFASTVKAGITWQELHTQLKVLRELIEADCDDKWFVFVPTAKIKVVMNPTALDAAVANFPSAGNDLEEAMFCYALERNTACVFHCMRVTEHGLRALARCMRIKLPKGTPLEWAEWRSILREMDKHVEKIAGSMKAGPAKDEILDFYRGALGQFYGFKDEYRNHVMHARASYDEHQAIRVLLNVRDFMTKLSQRIDEKGRKVKA